MANREYKSRYVTLVPSQTANHNVSVTTNTVRSNNFDVSDANAVTIEVWVKSIGANASATISLEHSATSGGTYSAVPENQGENVTADEVGVYRIAYLGDNRFVRAVTIEVWVKSIGANASATISLEHSATSGGTYSAVPENQGENVTADEVGVYRIAYLGDNRFVRAVVDPDGSSTIAARVEYAARLDELKTAPRD